MRRHLTARSASTRLVAGVLTAGAWVALSAVVGVQALAAPVTIWVDPQIPDAKIRERADAQTGGTIHLDQREILYPPQPETPADQEQLDEVREALNNAKDRWDEFEIELPVSTDLEMVLADVRLVRQDRDREELVRALLFQGAAVARAFAPDQFATDARAADFRFVHEGRAVPEPWVDAYALSGKLAAREDLIDGTAWQDYQRFAEAIKGLPKATLTIPEGVGKVVVDGKERAVGELSLAPGRHWVHVVDDGVVSGRAVVMLAPGATQAFPTAVTEEQLVGTHDAVPSGVRGRIPDEAVAVLEAIEAHHGGGPLFLAIDTGRQRPAVLGFSANAVPKDTRLLTHVLTADFGGGVYATNAFVENTAPGSRRRDDALAVSGAASASLGYELGVSYFMLSAGLDGTLTPGFSLPYGDQPADTTNAFSAHAQPYIGFGAYAIRPTKPTPTFNVAFTLQYLAPASLGLGGRMALGIPIDKRNWFRVSLGSAYAIDSYDSPDAVRPTILGWLRLGFGAGL